MTKKRKKYVPKPVFSNPLAAFHPVDKTRADTHMLKFFSALESMAKAARPDAGDWRILSDCINLVETLSLQKKLTIDIAPLLDRGVQAMVDAGNRWHEGKRMGLSGEGLQSLRDVVDVYGQCLALLTERDMELARLHTQKRLEKIYRNGGAPGQSVVMV